MKLAIVLALIMFSGSIIHPEAARLYKVAIVTDTQQDFAVKLREGFASTLDALLAKQGAKAAYTVWDTELDPAKCPGIIDGIGRLEPDLVFTINYPTGFADIHVTNKLKEAKYRFVSLNAVPVQSKTIASWEKPGGNVTGISVFLSFNPQIKLMRKIRPEAKKLVVFTWSAMALTNDWYLSEIRRACEEEGIELAATLLVPDVESQLAALLPYADKGKEYFGFGIISAWVHKDGRPADTVALEGDFMRTKMNIPMISYDENGVIIEAVAGCCVIWGDIGAQAAEKGMLVLGGKNPGDLPWEYPRKYNILLNLAAAKRLGIAMPQSLINAAYRVYTDFDGHFAGQGD